MRNNIEKSRNGGTRLLGTGLATVQWSFSKAAYNWDQRNSSLTIHERLTEEHFLLGYASKMRNHLAIDVLNKRMLFLMKVQTT